MNQSALWVQFDRYRFVLGMEWRLLEPTEKLVRARIARLRREGLQWYATRGVQDFVGVCSAIARARQPMHSAALHLADQWSQGGLELYVFGMPEQRAAVIALNHGRPVPGFDFIGSIDEAQALIEEFEAIEEGEPIRRVGDLGLLADEEKLSAQLVFDQPTPESRLRKIPSLKVLVAFAAGLLLLLVALGAAYYWQGQQRQALVIQLPVAPPPDPNPAYDQRTGQTLQELPLQSQALYEGWIRLLQRLPLNHVGWALMQVECKADACTADWRRQFGSLEDFHRRPPPVTERTVTLASDKDALTQSLQTVHRAIVTPAGNEPPQLKDLPEQELGFRQLSSWLQDISLLGGRNLQLDKAQVWGAPANGPPIQRPLLKGSWSAELPLALAGDLVLPAFVTVTQLKTQVGESYQLSGEYLVRPPKP